MMDGGRYIQRLLYPTETEHLGLLLASTVRGGVLQKELQKGVKLQFHDLEFLSGELISPH